MPSHRFLALIIAAIVGVAFGAWVFVTGLQERPAALVPVAQRISPQETSSMSGSSSEHSAVASNVAGVSQNDGAQYDIEWGELYTRYLDSAESGDANAQYVLLTALHECSNTASSEQVLEDLIGDWTPQDAEHVRQRFRKCKPLRDMLPDLRSEHDRWYSAVSRARHPLLLVKNRNRPTEDQRRYLRQAIEGPYPERHLYAEAYMAAAMFYRDYAEQQNRIREEAWLWLYCDNSPVCRSDEERELLKLRVHAHQYEEIVMTVASLREAMEQHQWDEVGF